MSIAKIYPLKGVVQHYSWGGNNYIPSLLGIENASHQPYAEYWLGAHPKAPSRISAAGDERPLDAFINQYKEAVLGKITFDKFGNLPYLLKVLDVKDMLSIQVHPDKMKAEKDFARENESGVSLEDPARNYKDANHKPELMVALSEFWLLHGFRKKKDLSNLLKNTPELQWLSPFFEKKGYEGLYHTVMSMPQEEVNDKLQPLLHRIIPEYHTQKLQKNQPDFWVARAALTFNAPGIIDRGIFSIYFFNLVHLKEGEAIYQAAGIPHAYLEGQNVEIMANSDNVLRGGLTTKHIDVKELIRHTLFEAVVPRIITPVQNGFQSVFMTEANDFELSVLNLPENTTAEHKASTLEILFVLSGTISLQEADTVITLGKGQSALLCVDASVLIKSREKTCCYLASVPIHNRA